MKTILIAGGGGLIVGGFLGALLFPRKAKADKEPEVDAKKDDK